MTAYGDPPGVENGPGGGQVAIPSRQPYVCVSLKHYSRSSVEYSLCVLQSLLQQPQHRQIIRVRLRLVLQRRFCSLHPSVSKRPKFPRQTPPHNRKLILLVGRRSISPLLFGHSQSVLRMVGQSACTRPDVLA